MLSTTPNTRESMKSQKNIQEPNFVHELNEAQSVKIPLRAKVNSETNLQTV